MPLVNAKCTNCGANLSIDSVKDAAICQHCGSAFIVENAINNYNIASVNISAGGDADNLLLRATEFYEQGGTQRANQYIEQIFDINANHAGAKQLVERMKNDAKHKEVDAALQKIEVGSSDGWSMLGKNTNKDKILQSDYLCKCKTRWQQILNDCSKNLIYQNEATTTKLNSAQQSLIWTDSKSLFSSQLLSMQEKLTKEYIYLLLKGYILMSVDQRIDTTGNIIFDEAIKKGYENAKKYKRCSKLLSCGFGVEVTTVTGNTTYDWEPIFMLGRSMGTSRSYSVTKVAINDASLMEFERKNLPALSKIFEEEEMMKHAHDRISEGKCGYCGGTIVEKSGDSIYKYCLNCKRRAVSYRWQMEQDIKKRAAGKCVFCDRALNKKGKCEYCNKKRKIKAW